MENIIILFIAYFLGAIPWAYIMAKLTKGIDIREYGSGNVGFIPMLLRTMVKVRPS
jgi:glycerol-3-phosphate acyltransferase PlsY